MADTQSRSQQSGREPWQLWVAIGLIVLAVIALVIGIVYLVVPANQLSVLPGHVVWSKKPRTKRGIAAIIAAIILAILAGVAYTMKVGKPDEKSAVQSSTTEPELGTDEGTTGLAES